MLEVKLPCATDLSCFLASAVCCWISLLGPCQQESQPLRSIFGTEGLDFEIAIGSTRTCGAVKLGGGLLAWGKPQFTSTGFDCQPAAPPFSPSTGHLQSKMRRTLHRDYISHCSSTHISLSALMNSFSHRSIKLLPERQPRNRLGRHIIAGPQHHATTRPSSAIVAPPYQIKLFSCG
jgi:hypothetical protein